MTAQILPLSWPGAAPDSNALWARVRELAQEVGDGRAELQRALNDAWKAFLDSGGPLRIGEIRPWIG